LFGCTVHTRKYHKGESGKVEGKKEIEIYLFLIILKAYIRELNFFTGNSSSAANDG